MSSASKKSRERFVAKPGQMRVAGGGKLKERKTDRDPRGGRRADTAQKE